MTLYEVGGISCRVQPGLEYLPATVSNPLEISALGWVSSVVVVAGPIVVRLRARWGGLAVRAPGRRGEGEGERPTQLRLAGFGVGLAGWDWWGSRIGSGFAKSASWEAGKIRVQCGGTPAKDLLTGTD